MSINGQTIRFTGFYYIYNLGSSFVMTKKLFLDGVEKDLVNIRDFRMTLISQPAWDKSSFEQKKLIVLHEMMGLVKDFYEGFKIDWISDTDYAFSIPLKRALDKNRITSIRSSLLVDNERPKYQIFPTVPVGDGTFSLFSDSRCLSALDYIFRPTSLNLTFTSRCNNSVTFATRSLDFQIEDSRIIKDGIEVGWISGFRIYIRTENEKIQLRFIPPYLNPYAPAHLDSPKTIDDSTRWSVQLDSPRLILRQIP